LRVWRIARGLALAGNAAALSRGAALPFPAAGEAATWLSSKGQWVRSKAGDAWEWVSETGAQVLRWTDEQLRAIWAEVQRYTDLTLDMLGKIDWVQVLIDVGLVVGTVVVAFVIAGALVTAGVPAAIVSGLLVLVRLAQLSWAWLASILGATASALSSAASTLGTAAGTLGAGAAGGMVLSGS
jgi:hypothetical protein